jgi:hypothetical protein
MWTAPSQSRASAERRFRLVLWLGMLPAIPLYYAVMRMSPPEALAADPTLPNILVPLSVVLAGLSIPIRKLVARSNPRNAFTLGLVLCEAAALFGMVAWFATGSPRSYYCLLAGAAGMLLHFPRAAHSDANSE